MVVVSYFCSMLFTIIIICNKWSLTEKNTSCGLWDERTEKDSACFVVSKENKRVGSQQSWSKEGTGDTVKARKLAYYGHTMRKQANCLDKEIMQGTMPGARRRGKPRTAWIDDIKTWTGLPVEESIRMTGDRNKWRKYVHGVANPRIDDG